MHATILCHSSVHVAQNVNVTSWKCHALLEVTSCFIATACYPCHCSGVGLTFLFGFLLLVFSAIVFFFGANAQKVCQALEGPEYPLFSEVRWYMLYKYMYVHTIKQCCGSTHAFVVYLSRTYRTWLLVGDEYSQGSPWSTLERCCTTLECLYFLRCGCI